MSAHRDVQPGSGRKKISVLVGLLVAGLFAFGILLGAVIGIFLAPDREMPDMITELPRIGPLAEEEEFPTGPPLVAGTRSSESAQKHYLQSSSGSEVPGEQKPDPHPPLTAIEEESARASAPLPVDEGKKTGDLELSYRISETLPHGQMPQKPMPQKPMPHKPMPPKPMIALVFDDLGIDQVRSRNALSLPGPVTLAFLPYGYNLQEMVESAHINGHEVFVHLPMAPVGVGIDPGPNALHPELEEAEILRRLEWNLSRFSGYVGVNNHMGSRFTADQDRMRLVLNELKRRGLIFLDSLTTPKSFGYREAASLEVPHAMRDVFLDHEITSEAIRTQLRTVEKIAREKGYAIAIGHPHDETLSVVREWIESRKALEFQLVPVSAIIQKKAG